MEPVSLLLWRCYLRLRPRTRIWSILRSRARSETVWQALGVPRRRLPVTLGFLAAMEAGLAALLIARPAVGLLVAFGVLLIYAKQLGRLDAGAPCHCFGASSATRAQTAIRRNVLLAAGAVCAAPLAAFADGRVIDPEALSAGLLVLACVAAVEASEHVRLRLVSSARP